VDPADIAVAQGADMTCRFPRCRIVVGQTGYGTLFRVVGRLHLPVCAAHAPYFKTGSYLIQQGVSHLVNRRLPQIAKLLRLPKLGPYQR
jgi:hypothetical protein